MLVFDAKTSSSTSGDNDVLTLPDSAGLVFYSSGSIYLQDNSVEANSIEFILITTSSSLVANDFSFQSSEPAAINAAVFSLGGAQNLGTPLDHVRSLLDLLTDFLKPNEIWLQKISE